MAIPQGAEGCFTDFTVKSCSESSFTATLFYSVYRALQCILLCFTVFTFFYSSFYSTLQSILQHRKQRGGLQCLQCSKPSGLQLWLQLPSYSLQLVTVPKKLQCLQCLQWLQPPLPPYKSLKTIWVRKSKHAMPMAELKGHFTLVVMWCLVCIWLHASA